MQSKIQSVLKEIKRKKLLRPRDLIALGIAPCYLWNLAKQNKIIRVAKGLYAAPDSFTSQHQSIIEVTKKAPKGVICLVSALKIHALTLQMPFEVWLALPPGVYHPHIDEVRVRYFHFSGQSFTSGIEEHVIGGVKIKVYCVAKTIADLFKFRNKVGIDIALEALKESLMEKKCTPDDIWHYAKICRVSKVIYPYLEALC